MSSKNDAIVAIKNWLVEWVIGLNLCPFAKAPFEKDEIRFVFDDCNDPYEALGKLLEEIDRLGRDEHQTTLIVYSKSGCFAEFDDFMDYCAAANDLLERQELHTDIQLAYFHPNFVFHKAVKSDPANAVNRSPFPVLHILKTEDVEKAIESHPNTESIPIANMNKLRKREK